MNDKVKKYVLPNLPYLQCRHPLLGACIVARD